MYLLYLNSQTFPGDGLRYLYPETQMTMPLAVNRVRIIRRFTQH
jgi:hypothetical protein